MHDAENDRTRPQGYLSFTLHAHLPWVVNHGTWPHGMEWLLEAAAETYLPLLRVLDRLERDGIKLRANLNLSPILLEQLAHPLFQAEFPRYLERKIAAAREDEAVFLSTGVPGFAATARDWQDFFSTALDQFHALHGRIHDGFRAFHESGSLELITSGATHGYMPLLGTDESLRAQVGLAVASHQRHLNLTPRGVWVPECGYRPAGMWSYPVHREDGTSFGEAFPRIGVEQALAENGIGYFLVDSHLVEGVESASPYRPAGRRGRGVAPGSPRRLYQPYFVEGPNGPTSVAVFPRDPRTGLQVWSGENGYPGDPMYLDFHKKRWPGGHRYWSVTGAGIDIGDKQRYDCDAAELRIRSHAEHFVDLVWKTLQPGFDTDAPPILSAPFDAELFGHWWFEGPMWLEQVARILHTEPTGLELITGSEYLERHKPTASIALPEGSWGAGGNHEVWLNHETQWTYRELYTAELEVRALCNHGQSQPSGALTEARARVMRQLRRELLLLESSDWQFLITTGAARDYAEQRFRTHQQLFAELRELVRSLDQGVALNDGQFARLAEIEHRDSIFPEIDPSLWCSSSDTAALPADDAPEESVETAAVIDGTVSELPKYLPQSEA